MTDKVKIKINRYMKIIDEKDLVLDNGACIQVITQCGSFVDYGYAPLIMSKKQFKDLLKKGFLIIDVSETKKAGNGYGGKGLYYFRFNIKKMIESGVYAEVEE